MWVKLPYKKCLEKIFILNYLHYFYYFNVGETTQKCLKNYFNLIIKMKFNCIFNFVIFKNNIYYFIYVLM